jgi:hypothetical protein
MPLKLLILYQIYRNPVGTRKNKYSAPYLFLLTSAAGIAVFITAWNSFLQGKEKIYVSLVFLILLLTGLLALYFHFVRLVSILKNSKPSEDLFPGEPSGQIPKKNVTDNPREASFSLLSGVFSKPDIQSIGEKILKNLAKEFEIVQGIFFVLQPKTGKFALAASYALNFGSLPPEFALGEGLTGQAIADDKIMVIPNLPESYSPVVSGLGKGKARYLYIIPLIHEKKSLAAIEISCFKEIEENKMPMLQQLMREGGLKLNAVLSPETK